MPSFTSFAVKTLLEPTTKIVSSSAETTDNPILKQPNIPKSESEEGLSNKPPASHSYIQSPSLYTTPEPRPIPHGASAQSDTPSPYVFNRKRRDVQSPTPAVSVGFEIQEEIDDGGGSSSSPRNCRPGSSGDEIGFRTSDGEIDGGVLLSVKLAEEEGEGDFEEALDCEVRSVASSCEFNDFSKQTIMSPKSVVFFDADDEFFSDGSLSSMSSSRIPKLESEMHTARLALLEEIERRKAAEDAVNHMWSQWQRIGRKLAELGLTFPTPLSAGNNSEFQAESVEQLIQELVVTRSVHEAIATDQARAEAEADAALIIESKNQEISRLRDRLQYYETVNQEMSHRNLEVAETTRRQREKRHQQRWLWGCIGMSVAVGASALAYSYFPRSSADLLATTNESDTSTSPPESS